MVKKLLFSVYVLIIVVMAVATVIGNYTSLDYSIEHIFTSWWFCLLWAVGIIAGIIYFYKSRVRRLSLVMLHLSFVVILAGALITHLTSFSGQIHLRKGVFTEKYVDAKNVSHNLPFSIRLDKFNISYNKGMAAAMDYSTDFTILQDGLSTRHTVSMNKIYNEHGIRLFQSSYDTDMHGSYIGINSDPYGILVTYLGYILLFVSLLWMLVDPKGTFRRLMKSKAFQKVQILLLFFVLPSAAGAQATLSKKAASEFGKVLIVYNGRICPTETYAIDFTKKLYGKASYKDFNANQVLAGFLFFGKEWMTEPIIKIKSGELRKRLGVEKYISAMQLFGPQGYILGPFLADAQTKQDAMSRSVLETDDKMMMLMSLSRGDVLKMFPFPVKGYVNWYSPSDRLPAQMPADQQNYVRNILPITAQLANSGQDGEVAEVFAKMQKYQQKYGRGSMPSHAQIEAENIYNHVPFSTILFILNVFIGLVSIYFLVRNVHYRWFTVYMLFSWLVLTFTISLRWIINGSIPMSNGYETMLFMAWLIMLVSLLCSRRIPVMTTFGLLMSGLMLLVSHLGQMDPAITPHMPVLNSPLLSLHVSVIMTSFTLLSLTFITGIAYFITRRSSKDGIKRLNGQLTALSQLFLYPAVATLAIGIFIGAIWANVSWGTYWGWDPKETWSLITLMIYAIALHRQSVPFMRKPSNYHLFMIMAWLSILVTYFGVNYFMPGSMHSYA